ncbi:hypothetical protein EMIHUDRAFT_215005 [Emiliania huxleyi CCMP1516]|uniref:UvrD-like helicase ATP-binding domain-containing protein n=2 Tax=Emiliania huxleyi TaxID=2903 RepID=A0A0D3IIS1_EMIH1|nr:hypothetical protein EMIHUDRAFT_215005 [Emiliania huxleyi CCMP1516]EOD11156.1 hypothetical protein EMIHUDRAFT_215005 [Emiliania huxleyi CCMP1516]|eukprot:XP_005763585.1 hypothetical protein EMIHUDRAFT_215005 [Emiliania huxleyi CCMP1516]
MPPAIGALWNQKLEPSERQKLELDEEENRLEFGINLASNVLSTSIDVATSLTVNGKSHLFNEVTQQRVPLPVYDQMDLVYLPVYLGLDLGSYTHVLVDELQDAFHIIWLFIQQMLLKGANLLMVGDFAQSIFFWAGGSQATHDEMVEYCTRQEHGRLHIMVANTVTAVTDVSDAEPAPGSHWFLTAWFVDPEDEE